MKFNQDIKIFLFISFLIHLMVILFLQFFDVPQKVDKDLSRGNIQEIDLINLKKSNMAIKILTEIEDKKSEETRKIDEINTNVSIDEKKNNYRQLHEGISSSTSYSDEGDDSEGTNNIDSFIQIIRERIEKVKNYPKIAQQNNWAGEVYLKFLITSNGEVIKIVLIKSSGFNVLDKSAITTVEKASPFLPFPGSGTNNEIMVGLPIIFRLQ